MRPARTLAAMTLVLALASCVPAQGVAPPPGGAEAEAKAPYAATVRVPEAEVRAGPSADPKLYPTNRLRQGDAVEVVRELEGGWLAIKPPPGSFSWINARFLQREGGNRWTVVAAPDAPVPVLYGSSLRPDKPTVEGTRLPRGTVVVGIDDRPRPADDGMWLSIEPPAREVRYLRADAVTPRPPAAPAPVIPASVPPPVGGQTTSNAPGGPPSAPAESDPRWLQAQQAEQAGRREEAIRLYEQLGAAELQRNHGLAMAAYSRAQFLRNVSLHSAQLPGRPADGVRPIPSADSRITPVPVALHAPSPPGPSGPHQPTTVSASPAAAGRSGPGRLRRACWCLDYQRTYALENSQGQARVYVTAQPGLDLEPFVNRNVEVLGPMVYRSDWRVYHLRATQVVPLP